MISPKSLKSANSIEIHIIPKFHKKILKPEKHTARAYDSTKIFKISKFHQISLKSEKTSGGADDYTKKSQI